MLGEMNGDGVLERCSNQFVMLIHRDSKALSAYIHPDFKLKLDRLDWIVDANDS